MSVEFRRDYLVRLPLPLAQLYSRAYNAKDARGRHDNTFYLFEALIKLTAAPRVAAYLQEVAGGAPRVPALDRLLAQLALPSLGQWLGILRELAKHFGQRGDAAAHPLGHLWSQLDTPRRDLPATLALYRRIKNGPDGTPSGDTSCSLLQVLDALVQYRNGVFGHGAGRFESFYAEEMGPLLFPAANELLAESVFDLLGPRGTRLVYLTELRTVDETQVELSLSELVGTQCERMTPLTLTAKEASGLVPNCVAVLWPGRRVPLRLDPLLIFRAAEFFEEVLFLNRDRNARQVEYLSYMTGRTERDRAMAPALTRLLSQVVGRKVTSEALDKLAAQSLAETSSVEALFAESRPAARVLGDYEVLAELGRGGMGVVYLARQLSLGRLVALKMLPADLGGDEVALARFRREIRALARCEHPHIVKVLSTGTMPDGQLYYTMEYVPGADLELVWHELAGSNRRGDASSLGSTTWARAVLSASQKLRERTARPRCGATDGAQKDTASGAHSESVADAAQPPPEAVPEVEALPLPPLPQLPAVEDDPGGYARRVALLMRDAALAVQAVHDQNIVHRDVKPSNLMLTPDGTRVVLMDFGLAKGQSVSVTDPRGRGLQGTLRYAAPEQLSLVKLTVGPQADVHALGVTLWELLTRQQLFGDAEDEQQLTSWVLTRNVPRLRTVDPTLDPDLDAIVLRATDRDASRRIQTARELAEYLDLYLADQPLPIRPPSTQEVVGRWVREHIPLVATGAVAALLVVLATIVAFVSITRSRNAAVVARNSAETSAASEAAAKQDAMTARDAAQEAQHQAEERSVELTRQVALNLIERGVTECTAHRVDAGVALLAGAYARLSADDQRRASVLRLMAAWSYGRRPPLRHDCTFLLAAAFSPDGYVVATGGDDGMVRMWDVATGRPHGEPLRHPECVYGVAFSPNGQLLATRCGDNTSRLWSVSTGKQLFGPLLHDNAVTAVSFSPDGRTVLTGSADKTARMWDATTGQPRCEPMRHEDKVHAVGFTSDGRGVWSTCEDGSVQIWDAANGRQCGEPLRDAELFSEVAVSTDGRSIVTLSPLQIPRIWEVNRDKLSAPKLRFVLESVQVDLRSDGQSPVAFSPGGQEILLPMDHVLQRFDTNGRAPTGRQSIRHGDNLEAFGYLPDDSRIVTAGGENNGIRIWDKRPSTLVAQLGQDENIDELAFSLDAQMFLTRSEFGAVRLWDLSCYEPCVSLRSDTHVVNAVAFSPDNSTVVTGGGLDDNTVRLWNAPKGVPLCGPLIHEGEILAVGFSPDGKRVVTGSEDKTARVWDVATGQPIGAPLVHTGPVRDVVFGADGRTILSISDGLEEKGKGNRWDLTSGKRLGDLLLKQPDECVRLGQDGQTVLTLRGGTDGLARFWDAETGQPRGPLFHTGVFASASFSWDGQTVLTADTESISLWTIAAGGRRGESLRLGEPPSSHALSPDGTTVLTGGKKGGGRLWDVVTAKPLGEPLGRGDGAVVSVALSPDGRLALTGFSGGANLWILPRPVPDIPEFVRVWAAVQTGWEVDENGTLRRITVEEWMGQWKTLARIAPERLEEESRLFEQRRARWHAHRAAEAEGGEYHINTNPFALAFHLSWLIDRRPDDADLRVRRAYSYLELDRLPEASLDLAEACRLRPQDFALARLHALSLLDFKHDADDRFRKQVRQMWDQFSQTEEKTTQLVELATLIPDVFDDYSPVLDRARASAERHPNDPAAQAALGGCYYRVGQFDEAIRVLSSALKSATKDDFGTYLGKVLLDMANVRTGRIDQAERRRQAENLRAQKAKPASSGVLALEEERRATRGKERASVPPTRTTLELLLERYELWGLMRLAEELGSLPDAKSPPPQP